MRRKNSHFEDKNVIITGGSSGIGKATAKLLAAEGANIFIVARDREKLNRAIEEIKSEADSVERDHAAFSADVTDYDEVEEVTAAIAERGGAPDILINCAGMVYPGYFEELPLSTFREQMDVNFFGTLHCVKAVVPYMMEQGGGHIANFSSVGGAIGVFGYTAYSASKFAVSGFSESLRAELKPHNIGVSLVLPFDTDTPQLRAEKKVQPLETSLLTTTDTKLENVKRPNEFLAYWIVKLFIDDGEPMTPEEVAEALLRGIKRGKFVVVPDTVLKIGYRIRGLLTPLAFWAYDQLIPLARRQRGAEEPAQHGGASPSASTLARQDAGQ